MTQPQISSTQSLPARPDLRQLRKQAKELLHKFRANDPAATAEVKRFEASASALSFKLAGAQRVLARSYGFSSWSVLKQHVECLNTESLIQSVISGDLAAVRKTVTARPELLHASGGTFGGCALHYAVCQRNTDMTSLLMELGANARNGIWPYREATTAISMATDRDFHDIVAIICEQEDRLRAEQSSPGATIDSRTDEILTAILSNRSEDAIAMMEADPSLVIAAASHGATPLHFAAWKHNPELVEWLLERNAAVDAENPWTDRPFAYPASADLGTTPLDYAAIVAGWSAHKNYFGWSPNNDHFPYLENVSTEPARFYECVERLRSRGAKLTPRAAVAIGDHQAVKGMDSAGKLRNDVHIVRGGLLAVAVRVNRIDMVSLLLELGIHPDEPGETNVDGERSHGFPLWFAAMCGRHEIAELLLANGADVNAVVYASGDALGNAIATRDSAMQSLLMQHGARLTVENIPRENAHETVRSILDGTRSAQSLNVANPTHAQLAEQLLFVFAENDPQIVLMCLPHVPRTPNDSWWLSVFMNTQLPETVRLLLEHGIDPNVSDASGAMPLHHLAAGSGSDEQQVAMATLLLNAGARLDARDSMLQSTPLGWACRWGQTELVKLLLARGADVIEENGPPWATPQAWAQKRTHHDIIALLESHRE